MENSAEHPGLSSEFAEIDSTVGGPRRHFAAGGAPGSSKVAASIEFAREGCRVTAKLKRAEHSRSDAQARRFQRQSDQRAVVAVIAQQSHGACGAPEKEELDKPAKTLSDVIQLQNCSIHSSTGF